MSEENVFTAPVAGLYTICSFGGVRLKDGESYTLLDIKEKAKFVVLGKTEEGHCQTCKRFSMEVGVETSTCLPCWHIGFRKEFPHLCKTEGEWRAYRTLDALPFPPGCF